MTSWIVLMSLALPVTGGAECPGSPASVASIRNERVTGSLPVAEAEARRLLACPDLEENTRRKLQIELARVLDRMGLHQNTRPVAEALELLRAAERSVGPDDAAGRAQVELALAESFYRAEMAERGFPEATERARRARALFRDLGDPEGETDAVHRLGLIALQKRQLEEARRLFDESLELSRPGPERLLFLSDYHRHVGFVDMLEGDQPAAIAHFGRSLRYREQAGSRDYGLFARAMLGTALIDGGRAAEAGPHLEEAVRIAGALPSPVGELRATYALGRMHEAMGEAAEAATAYRHAEGLASELGIAGLEKAAHDGLVRVADPGRRGPS